MEGARSVPYASRTVATFVRGGNPFDTSGVEFVLTLDKAARQSAPPLKSGGGGGQLPKAASKEAVGGS